MTASTCTMSCPIVRATFVVTSAPAKFIAAASVTAARGERARVETEVATAFAVSWKPLVKSKNSATTTTTTSSTPHQPLRNALSSTCAADSHASMAFSSCSWMSFQRITTSASVLPAKSARDGLAQQRVACVLERVHLDEIRARGGGVVHALDRLRERAARVAHDHGLGRRRLGDVADAVHDHLARGLVDVIADVVEASRQRVQVLAVVRDDEGVVEQPYELMGQLVADGLELADALGDGKAAGEPREELDQQLGDLDEVVRRAREQLGEVVISRYEAHASREPTRFDGASARDRYP